MVSRSITLRCKTTHSSATTPRMRRRRRKAKRNTRTKMRRKAKAKRTLTKEPKTTWKKRRKNPQMETISPENFSHAQGLDHITTISLPVENGIYRIARLQRYPELL